MQLSSNVSVRKALQDSLLVVRPGFKCHESTPVPYKKLCHASVSHDDGMLCKCYYWMSQTTLIFASFYKAKMPGCSIQNNM